MADAERKQQARQRRVFAGGDTVENILRPFDRRFFAAAVFVFRLPVAAIGLLFHFLQVGKRQAGKVGEAADDVLLDQRFDLLLAETVDVHRFAGGKVDQALRALGLAQHAAGAAGDSFVFFALDGAAAHRAVFRQPESGKSGFQAA